MKDERPDLARWRRALTTSSGQARPQENCPPAERIWAAVRGELSPEEFRAAGLHAIACEACSEAWRLALDVSSEVFHADRPVVDELPAQARAPWRVWWRLAAAAATVSLVLIGVQIQRELSLTPAPGYRAQIHDSIRSLLPQEAALPRDRLVLRWEGPEGATYDIRVATEDLRILDRATGLTAGEHLVPEQALVDLEDGARIVWQVEAVLGDGTRVVSESFVSQLK